MNKKNSLKKANDSESADKLEGGHEGAADNSLEDLEGPLVVLQQIASPNRKPKKQRATLIGLGLNKMNRLSVLKDTPCVRGMIRKVAHLVEIIAEYPSQGELACALSDSEDGS